MKKQKYSKNIDLNSKVEIKFDFFRKDRLLLYFIGFIFIGIMVGSVFTMYNDNEDKNTVEYNGFKFTPGQGGWLTTINNVKVGFDYAPYDVENITSEKFSLDSSRVYLMYNPSKMNENTYDIVRTFGFLQLSGKSVNLACSKEEGCGDFPVKDCNSTDKIVYLKDGNQDKIYNDKNCVVVEGKDLLKVENLFYYKLLGVIK